MNQLKVMKLLRLIIGVVILNIIVLSPGILGVTIGESALESAFGVTLLFVSFVVLIYGSYVSLFKPPAVTPIRHMKTHDDYVEALNHYRHVKVLNKDVHLALDQLERIEKKKLTLIDVLGQRFDPSELSFRKFNSVINEVEKLLYINIRGILNKLSVFDAAEFSNFTNLQSTKQLSDRLTEERSALYNEYLSYVSGYLEANEEILLKLDKLLLEITLLSSSDYRDVEEMPCMKEIDVLIKQTKFYKEQS